MRIAYIGKAKNMTLKEIWLCYTFGRPVEPIEAEDFNRN